MSLVTDYVEERQNEIESEGQQRRNMRRVTVRLPGDIFAMLTEVAKALEDTNTGCAEELLGAAITEAWKAIKPRTLEDVQRVMSALVSNAKAEARTGAKKEANTGSKDDEDA